MNVFNESMCQIVLPGLAHSCEYLVKLVRNEKGQSSEMGIAISGAVLCAHTAELLLKYKLDQEGKTFKPTHDLHKLYLLLSNESKDQIQKEFDELVSQIPLPPNGLPTGWDSAEAVFRSACCISTEWRYVIEKNPKSRKSPVFSLDSLYIAVVSVLRTTTLGAAMQTRETMKVEDIRSGYQSEGFKSHEQERDCSMNRFVRCKENESWGRVDTRGNGQPLSLAGMGISVCTGVHGCQ